MARDYRKIRAWQLADAFALEVYTVTRGFPKSEMFGLTSQMRRAAVSVAANVVEGSARQHEREYVQFLYMASGSLAESGYYVDLAHRLKYATDADYRVLAEYHDSAARTLRALINYIERGSRTASSESNVHGPKSNVPERSHHV
jgi:four helix bundle protein